MTKTCFSFFDGNNTPYPNDAFPCFLATGDNVSAIPKQDNAFDTLNSICNQRHDWIISYLGYDLKNKLEDLHSQNTDHVEFPESCSFIPDKLVFFHHNHVEIQSHVPPEDILDEINSIDIPASIINKAPEIKCDTEKLEYITTVKKIINDIENGDYYELNYCMEFFADQAIIDPISTFLNLLSHSQAPFSVLQKMRSNYIISASPERFLKKTGDEIISQPMKGTRPRGKSSLEDQKMKEDLRTSEKEIAENMMIVDLVRNDLAKSCIPGSVIPEEMFEVYSFPHVHQMISTIRGRLKPDTPLLDPVKNAFPMGSMTGAPKIMVMDRIDLYENSMRGPFSGTAGFITPEGNFDFNVLIRSIFYNAETQKLKFNAGSAITYDSDPLMEYDECLLKARSLQDTLSGKY